VVLRGMDGLGKLICISMLCLELGHWGTIGGGLVKEKGRNKWERVLILVKKLQNSLIDSIGIIEKDVCLGD
jgi:hypothetical protein